MSSCLEGRDFRPLVGQGHSIRTLDQSLSPKEPPEEARVAELHA